MRGRCLRMTDEGPYCVGNWYSETGSRFWKSLGEQQISPDDHSLQTSPAFEETTREYAIIQDIEESLLNYSFL